MLVPFVSRAPGRQSVVGRTRDNRCELLFKMPACSVFTWKNDTTKFNVHNSGISYHRSKESKMTSKTPFGTSAAFCAQCGAILPLLKEFGSVQCYSCKTQFQPESFGNIKFQYTINFNAVSTYVHENILNVDDPEGPIVERRCPKCGNDRMSYATLQLRSADEGQTVFYTCITCKYKETENS